jgi:hypothetical protein
MSGNDKARVGRNSDSVLRRMFNLAIAAQYGYRLLRPTALHRMREISGIVVNRK